MAIADDTAEGIFVWFDGVMTKLHNLRASEAGQMLVRVTAYNFTEHHKTFTITHIVDEIDRVPLLDVADDWDDGDDDDDKPAAKPLPVEVQSGGVSGNAHKKTVDSTSNVFKKARISYQDFFCCKDLEGPLEGFLYAYSNHILLKYLLDALLNGVTDRVHENKQPYTLITLIQTIELVYEF
ncbi:hypothetical protein YC2023_076336 [Brassica napus]